LTLLACTLPAHADGTAAALYKTGSLSVDVVEAYILYCRSDTERDW
jgi:hypothetical protein